MTSEIRPTQRPPARPFRTLLAEHQGQDYAEHDDGRGKVRLWHLGHRIGIFESSGNIGEDHSNFIIAFHRKHIEPHPRPWYTFGNWMTLEGYSPEVRRGLTEWQRVMKYDGLHVAHNSRLLAMSINIANAVLENTVEVVTNEEELDDVLVAVRKRIGV
ncbi:MAG: hypothetical protein KC593_19645 [Myxococcales bacterium]|nr:hypothetical protein [Myxococcales bacterium]